jgi:hypothetical protein
MVQLAYRHGLRPIERLRRCSISAEPHRSSAVTQKPRRTNFSLRWRLRQGPPQKETPSLVRTGRGWGLCCLT